MYISKIRLFSGIRGWCWWCVFAGLLWANFAVAESRPQAQVDEYQKATFAGGCFWCMEKPFDVLPGVVSTVSGYSGGHVRNPSYKQVTSGKTGHYEVVQITFDPKKISYEKLLDVFWRNVDPLDGKGQFCDKGSQYLSGVFYHSIEQQKLAEKSLQKVSSELAKLGKVKTEIIKFKNFYAAEDYHQNYYQENPIRYRYYRTSCGRDKRLRAVWGKLKK